MNLLVVEMRRALHRRAIRVLVGLGLAMCVVAGLVAFTASSGKTLFELTTADDSQPAVMRDWWIAGTGDGVLSIASFFLVLGGLFGGATVAGAEWRANTITTVLTWEPRRTRLNAARTASSGLLAFLIAFALQAIFLVSFVPAVLAHGTTAGTDADWWIALAGAMARTSVLTGLAAVLGVAFATIGRNTAFALVTVFAWVAVIENLVRGLKPGLAGYLWGENIATVLTWAQLDDVDFTRGPLTALATVALYTAVTAVLASATFSRRDVAGVS